MAEAGRAVREGAKEKYKPPGRKKEKLNGMTCEAHRCSIDTTFNYC
jgi:hypothetical protein